MSVCLTDRLDRNNCIIDDNDDIGERENSDYDNNLRVRSGTAVNMKKCNMKKDNRQNQNHHAPSSPTPPAFDQKRIIICNQDCNAHEVCHPIYRPLTVRCGVPYLTVLPYIQYLPTYLYYTTLHDVWLHSKTINK